MDKIEELLVAIFNADDATPGIAFKLWDLLAVRLLLKDKATIDELAADFQAIEYLVNVVGHVGTD